MATNGIGREEADQLDQQLQQAALAIGVQVDLLLPRTSARRLALLAVQEPTMFCHDPSRSGVPSASIAFEFAGRTIQHTPPGGGALYLVLRPGSNPAAWFGTGS